MPGVSGSLIYETWLVASAATLAGHHGLPTTLVAPDTPEQWRDAKGWLSRQMPRGTIYKETFHQAKFTSLIDLGIAAQGSRSFRRLVHAVDQLVAQEGVAGRGWVSP